MSLMRRRCLAALGGSLLLPMLPRAALARGESLRMRRTLLGTAVDVVVDGSDPHESQAAVSAAFVEMQRLEGMMSRYQPTSRVSALHLASGLLPVQLPPEMMSVLRVSKRLSLASEGAFDPTVGAFSQWSFQPGQTRVPSPSELAHDRPLVDFRDLVLDEKAQTAHLRRRGMRLDLGGVAKLPILQAGMQVLQRHGIRRAMINGGGDVGVIGGGAQPWRVGLRDPMSPDRVLGVLELAEGWVASSGDYERCFEQNGRRYHHVLDPRTGYPTQGPRGVVMVSEDSMQVTGLGAAMMVSGWRRGQSLVPAEAQALLVERDGAVRTTRRWNTLKLASA